MQLAWSVVKKHVLDDLPVSFRFCGVDSDGAAWSVAVLDEYPGATGVAVCASRNGTADTAVEESDGRLSLVHAHADDLSAFVGDTFDVTFSLGDLLARTQRVDALMSDLVRITKPGGVLVCSVPNLYHVVGCHVRAARFGDAKRALGGRARLSGEGGDVNVFTPLSLEQAIRRAGACPRLTLGLPVVLPDEDSADGGSDGSHYSEMLGDDQCREDVLEIERALSGSSLAPRGSRLISIAVVSPPMRHWGDFWL